ncbi:hypothetical protein FDP41_002139 [Naegleria fowleri]|uniref:DUF541 domain-containing protein n=1 Tax=Naegleria fowleri TaxID=5763 RepID=A0A6A5C1I1_NAEFO|nr:uncharacterized protein FDP41_002139 [Naegleria fowleri]KAF0979069.1 hypothetical protein FDP41_002139 [Naegleria fowleri]CAG4712362.1 unnamed protein product [Naegleria fowleri]
MNHNSRNHHLVVACCLISLAVLYCSLVFAQDITLPLTFNVNAHRFNSSLTVRGTGTVKIPVTQADITLSVEAQRPTATEAQRVVGDSSARVVQTLQQMDYVFKLRTSSISLFPVYTYNESSKESYVSGYRSSNTVSFSLSELRNTGAVLDKLVELGVTTISAMNLVANETQIAQARNKANELAVQDAMAKASRVLSAIYDAASMDILKQRLEITEVNIEGSAPVALPVPMYSAAGGDNSKFVASSAIPVVGGDQTVESYVSLKLQY